MSLFCLLTSMLINVVFYVSTVVLITNDPFKKINNVAIFAIINLFIIVIHISVECMHILCVIYTVEETIPQKGAYPTPSTYHFQFIAYTLVCSIEINY